MARRSPEESREAGYDWITLVVALVIAVVLAVATLEIWNHR